MTEQRGLTLDEPEVGSEARRAERADWMQRYEPEVITARYLSLIREVIEEAGAKRNETSPGSVGGASDEA